MCIRDSTNTEARSKKKEDDIQEQRRLLEELNAEKERLMKEKKEFWDMIEAEIKRIPMAMQLHLELDLGYFAEEHKKVLRRYGLSLIHILFFYLYHV